MEHPRFELSSAQTLRLEELRKILIGTLPVDVAETVEFPVANFTCIDCGTSTCIGSCLTSCSSGCVSSCVGGCKGSCTGTCQNSCRNSCEDRCLNGCYFSCTGRQG